jgi:hypothetical protein
MADYKIYGEKCPILTSLLHLERKGVRGLAPERTNRSYYTASDYALTNTGHVYLIKVLLTDQW